MSHLLEKYNTEQFCQDLDALSIVLSDSQIEQFLFYYEMLTEKNKVMNLTAITEFEEVMKKHFIDSLSLIKAYNMHTDNNLENCSHFSVIDIGTGGGFPGIPLKIAFPHLKVTLIDSLNKRVDFLREVIAALGLHDIEAVHGRAEDYAKPGQLREQFDLCVSRAVSKLSVLSEYCLPYVRVGGQFISYKSEKAAEEIRDAEYAIRILGGKVTKQISFTLPNSDLFRNLFVIDKCNPTPARYPRKAGTASKNPLNKKG